MLTVPEVARRVGRDPETVRRWIRSGRLRSTKVGTQHLIDEADIEDLARGEHDELPVPDYLQRTAAGEPMSNVVAWIHRSREGR